MKLRRWCSICAIAILIFVGSCALYLRSGTEVIADFVSPDGVRHAVLLVRNGGAMTGYSTHIALVHAHNPVARQVALIRGGDLFVADDNDGAVRWEDRGQLEVMVKWISNAELLVQYPVKARVFKQEKFYDSTVVRYEAVSDSSATRASTKSDAHTQHP